MHSHFTHAARLFAAGVFGACACGLAQTPPPAAPPAALARPPAQAVADIPAPGYTAVLQSEFPERKFPELQEILRQGLISGPTILMSEWNAAASAQDARGYGGRADMLPHVNGYLEYGPSYEQQQGTGSPSQMQTALLYDLRFYQPVYQWNMMTNNYQIKKLAQAMAERNIAETRRALAIDIRRRYFDIILRANALKLARENMDRLERNRKEIEQAIKDGTNATGDIDGPNRAIQSAKPDIMQRENELADLKRTLVQITGLPESVIDKMPAEIPALPEAEIHDALYALTASTSLPPSPHLQDLADNARIWKLTYENSKKTLLPKLGLVLDVNEQNRTPDGSNQGPHYIYTTWSALLHIDWTVFDGFGAQAARRAAMERLKMAEATRSQAGKQEDADRRNDALGLQVQWEQLLYAEGTLARAQAGRDVNEQDFKNGTVSARNVEDARVAYENVLQDTYKARADFYIALVTCLSNRGQDPMIMAMEQ